MRRLYSENVESFERELQFRAQEENQDDWKSIVDQAENLGVLVSIGVIAHSSYQTAKVLKILTSVQDIKKAYSALKKAWNLGKLFTAESIVGPIIMTVIEEIAINTAGQYYKCKDFDSYCRQYFGWWDEGVIPFVTGHPNFITPMFEANVVNKNLTWKDKIILMGIEFSEVDIAVTGVLKVNDNIRKISTSLAGRNIENLNIKDLDLTKVEDCDVDGYYGFLSRNKNISDAFKKKGKVFLSQLTPDEVIDFNNFAKSLNDTQKRELTHMLLTGGEPENIWRRLRSFNDSEIYEMLDIENVWRLRDEYPDLNLTIQQAAQKRGRIIENYLAVTDYIDWAHAGAWKHNFPYIDFADMKNGTVKSLKTVDPITTLPQKIKDNISDLPACKGGELISGDTIKIIETVQLEVRLKKAATPLDDEKNIKKMEDLINDYIDKKTGVINGVEDIKIIVKTF